jgi:predicted RNase H-like nuclease (RuvC/YqgF family)
VLRDRGDGICNKSAIYHLQTELRASRSKLKLKAAVTAQQENLLAERQASIEKSLRENSAVREQVAALKAENETLKSKVRRRDQKRQAPESDCRSKQCIARSISPCNRLSKEEKLKMLEMLLCSPVLRLLIASLVKAGSGH